MMLEADVVIGKVNNTGSDIPIMAHPPANSSDLSLNDFLNEVFEYNSKVNSPQIKKGVKLDFKSIEALDGSVPIIDALYNNCSNNLENLTFGDLSPPYHTPMQNKYTDMLLVFRFCEGNTRECVRMYSERFPNRRIPSHPTFATVERRLRETGRFAPATADYGRQRFIRIPEVEEEILERVEGDLEISTRRIGRELGVCKDVHAMTYPVWINSDIVAGPVNATTIPVNPQSFFTAARNFTNSTLSIGWTTNYSGSDIAIYDNSQIDSMLTTIHTNNVSQSLTFPVRASIAAHSLSQMQTLLSNVSGSTLTIWSNDDIINVTKLNELIMTVGVNKTYLDLPDNIMKQLDLTGDGSALKPTIMMICALLIATLMLQL
ncbi:menorin (dendritic branching protein) [Holotrichia oblita]|uniref:Menorin (Dendritic branching protein) n=1 Tax=Holotrichia oblita TaxID=644536 RepID=A0ACB9T9G0_HOLOL|nr:menorin (dendritic branching protein) [Holotrichia oblita]